MHVHLRWPDGSAQRVYSPSLVITDHLTEGTNYPVAELVSRLDSALAAASDRVRASYGFPCTRAAASRDAVRGRAAGQPDGGSVLVEAFERH